MMQGNLLTRWRIFWKNNHCNFVVVLAESFIKRDLFVVLKMALKDIKMERVPESAMLRLPPISKGDFILVLAQGAEWGNCLLFCSDGRVAQTDMVVVNPYETAYEIQREAQGCSVVPPDLSEIQRLFVDEAVKRGFLREYVTVFGRDHERYNGEPTVGVESRMLYLPPMVLFGVDLSCVVDSVVRVGTPTSRVDVFDTLNPYEHGFLSGERTKIVSYSTKSVKEVLVGEEAILSKLRSVPVEFRLEKDLLNSE